MSPSLGPLRAISPEVPAPEVPAPEVLAPGSPGSGSPGSGSLLEGGARGLVWRRLYQVQVLKRSSGVCGFKPLPPRKKDPVLRSPPRLRPTLEVRFMVTLCPGLALQPALSEEGSPGFYGVTILKPNLSLLELGRPSPPAPGLHPTHPPLTTGPTRGP